MTYQYSTVDMIRTAKENGGFIDQKKFKTASKYGFDSLILTDTRMQVSVEWRNMEPSSSENSGEDIVYILKIFRHFAAIFVALLSQSPWSAKACTVESKCLTYLFS